MKHDSSDIEGQLAALEGFASDLSALEELERVMAEFDAFAFLGLSSSEEIHSNVLAWLLSPGENHSLGDFFLKRFLLETGAASQEEVSSCNWSDTAVQREWRNVVGDETGYLDILVVNHDVPFACAIENKIFSGEHGRQLSHYRKALEQHYPQHRRSYVFLSPRGTAPNHPADRQFWSPMSYVTILGLVDAALETAAELGEEAVAAFLRQYATCLRRTVVPSGEVRKLAAAIYQRHKEAIDLIVRHKDAYVEDLRTFCKQAISQQDGWVLESDRGNTVGFAPADWKHFAAFHTGTGWRDTDAALLFHFDLREHQTVNLILTIPRGDHDDPVRRRLFEMARRHPDKFNPRGSPLGGSYTDRWIRLHTSEPVLSKEDFVNWDEALAWDRIGKWVTHFAVHEFPAMNEAIIDCFRQS